MIARRMMRRRMLVGAAAVGGTAYVAGKHRAANQAADDYQESPLIAGIVDDATTSLFEEDREPGHLKSP